jgi:hypothetical protein
LSFRQLKYGESHMTYLARNTVKPGKAYPSLITASCEVCLRQCKCVYWKSVCEVYKSLSLLTDVCFITLYLTSQSIIRSLKL